MSRPIKPELMKPWKIHLPATLAGIVEFYLFDSVHNKPLYGSRSKLITDLLNEWVEQQKHLATQSQPDFAPTIAPEMERVDG